WLVCAHANTPLMIYTMAENFPESLRASFIADIKQTDTDVFHLFALADVKAIEMLTGLGLSVAREVDDPAEVAGKPAAVETRPAPEMPRAPAAVSPRLQSPTLRQPVEKPITPVKKQIPLEERDPILSAKAR